MNRVRTEAILPLMGSRAEVYDHWILAWTADRARTADDRIGNSPMAFIRPQL